jgi:hypothetical protein
MYYIKCFYLDVRNENSGDSSSTGLKNYPVLNVSVEVALVFTDYMGRPEQWLPVFLVKCSTEISCRKTLILIKIEDKDIFMKTLRKNHTGFCHVAPKAYTSWNKEENLLSNF